MSPLTCLQRNLPVLCLALGACDPQAASSYAGESLLSLSGSLTIEQDSTQTPLVPAIAFEGRNELLVMDVESRGEFPASFELDVYQTPPESALGKFRPNIFASQFPSPGADERAPGEPAVALGYITAVADGHPDVIALASQGGGQRECDEQACYWTTSVCDASGTSCYTEEKRCDLQYEQCELVSSSGDRSLVEGWERFPGLSSDYRVLYLDGAAEAGTPISNRFGGGKKLGAGYHLLTVRALTAQEESDAAACTKKAEDDVVADFNREHGTSHTTLEEVCGLGGCNRELPYLDEVDALRVERGCILDSDVLTPVADPDAADISVHIKRKVGPLAGGAQPQA